MTEVKKKREIPTQDNKAKIALEAIRGVKTINQISQEYGMHGEVKFVFGFA